MRNVWIKNEKKMSKLIWRIDFKFLKINLVWILYSFYSRIKYLKFVIYIGFIGKKSWHMYTERKKIRIFWIS